MKLPKGWEIVRLQDMVSYVKGKKPRILSNVYKEGLVPYIDIKAFEKGKIRQYADVESSKLLKEDDILVVWDGARSGLVGIGRTGAIGSTIASLTPRNVNSKYLFYYLQTKYEFLNSNPRGTGIPHIDPNLFWNIEIPLAPLNEQRRIVAKLEKLLAKVDSCNERLEKIPAILKQFRQSVLTAACSGRLTEDWRKKNPDIEPVHKLLKRIREEKIKINRENQVQKINSLHKEVVNNIMDGHIDIPESWKSILSDELFYFITSGSRGWAKYYSHEGQIFVRVGNLNRDSIDLDLKSVQRVKLPNDVEGLRTRVQANDILISITADTGRIALIPQGIEEAYINQHIALARPLKGFSVKYVAWYLASSEGGLKQFLKLQRGVTKAGLGLDDIRNVWIPFPPLAEQHEIVRRVEALFKIADQIEKRYKKAKTYVDRLTQAILAKAFRGELVPQDPNDEPASALLDRIKQEKVKLGKEKK